MVQIINIGLLRDPYKSMSRAAMTAWFTPWTGSCRTLAELSDALGYALLLDGLFPDCVDKKKLKQPAKDERDKTANWIEFQRGLVRLNVDKKIDIAQLVKPASVAGFDFCKWFICFFEMNQRALAAAAPPPPPVDEEKEEEVPRTWRVDTPIRRTRESDFVVPTLDDVIEEDEMKEEEQEEEQQRTSKKWAAFLPVSMASTSIKK